MSEVKHATVYYPPEFPLQGRLPTEAWQVHENHKHQSDHERAYHSDLCIEAGRRVMAPCCKTLHITLCFDGTGNNLYNDLYVDDTRHPTNIARMFRASVGVGHVGGGSHSLDSRQLVDAEGVGNGKYFKYYIPGLGTPFPEIGDKDYTLKGLATGAFGEERINWALMMIVDALRRAHSLPLLEGTTVVEAIKEMGTWAGMNWITGRANRARESRTQLEALYKPLQVAMGQPYQGHPKLLGIKLYVYGFSRGAALARAFVSWLNDLLAKDTDVPSLQIRDLRLPISVAYLGLLDTVASVGVASVVKGIDGHMDWADGSQAIPEGGLVKRCLHLVAAHEQRLCFPLESIRRETGEYPADSLEVVYPGVHSDIGGGYTPGAQGKSIDTSERFLLSQVTLNDLYMDAFCEGAPLKVPKEALPKAMSGEFWRIMAFDVIGDFRTHKLLADRFNGWQVFSLTTLPEQPVNSIYGYYAVPSQMSLEHSLREQMSWLTAWRIDRYGFATLKQTQFYLQAPDLHADIQEKNKAKEHRRLAQLEVETHRKYQEAKERDPSVPKRPLKPGVKGFEAVLDKTQLREAAEEFAAHFRGPGLFEHITVPLIDGLARLKYIPALVLKQLTDSARAERQAMKEAGQARVAQMFPVEKGYFQSHLDENTRVCVDESRNADEPLGLLRALFDNHVHDSRASFLYDAIPPWSREPGGSYFAERMVFFADSNRRDLAVYTAAQVEMLASGQAIPPHDALLEEPEPSDAERMAQIHQAIDAQWQALPGQPGEANDAHV